MMKNVIVLGSTGSIGTQTLDVISRNEDMSVVSLAAYGNIDLLEEQIRKFLPRVVCVYQEEKAQELKERVTDLSVEVLTGMEGLIACATIRSIISAFSL